MFIISSVVGLTFLRCLYSVCLWKDTEKKSLTNEPNNWTRLYNGKSCYVFFLALIISRRLLMFRLFPWTHDCKHSSSVEKDTHRRFVCPSDPQSCHNPNHCTSSEYSALRFPRPRTAAVIRSTKTSVCMMRLSDNCSVPRETYMWGWPARSRFLASALTVPKFHDEEHCHQ